MLLFFIFPIDSETGTFPSGSMQGSQVCVTFGVTDNQLFQASPVAMYTVTLSSLNTRVTVGSSRTTSVTITDDDGVFFVLQDVSTLVCLY